MFLKQLDIVGFKSFAERVTVDFVTGVTAVVGPNGSGKSNITDAIRWVLGEQSAKSLRGVKMGDVIFAGSDTRKPLNYAEVTLTLDNHDQFLPLDYSEVSVTRRVFRSGDSEYLINKQPCRLKDIVELFMDSGLGREAFSIISQGRVEEILNSKPEERRTIFEEAAGVLKYKTRKKKAEVKLSETKDNLNRVNDILHELETQVEPLKMQASIAKDYLQQKEELEQFEVGLTVYEIEDLHKKWEQHSNDFDQQQQQEIALSAEVQTKEAKIAEVRDRTVALDESVNELQEVLLHASEALEKLEGRKEVLKERKKNASQNKEQLQKNKEVLTIRVEELKKLRQEQDQKTLALKSEASTYEKQLSEKLEQLKLYSVDIDEQIENLKSEYIDLLNTEAAAKNEQQMLQKQLTQQATREEKLIGDNSRYIEEREVLLERKAALLHDHEAVKAQLDNHIHQYRQKQKEYEMLQQTYEKDEKKYYQAIQFLQQAQSRKEMLEELKEDYSGFFQGVKEVLKERNNRLTGIEGAVAELIEVPKEYQTAMEVALGAAMQHIVVQTEADGRKAIQYLKSQSYGRATFLPLDVLKKKTLNEAQLKIVKEHEAYIGTAASLLQYDAKYAPAIESLLGNVIIANDLKGANTLAKLLGYRVRIVTLDGDIVNPGGSMTGGAVKQNKSSILSRKNELDDLNDKITHMDQQTKELEARVKKMKQQFKDAEHILETLKQKGEQLREEEQSRLGLLKDMEYEEKRVNDRLSLYDLDKAQFVEEKSRFVNRENELTEILRNYAEEIISLDNQIKELTQLKNVQQTSKESLQEEINELKVQFASKSEQLKSAQDRLRSIVSEKADTEEKLQLVIDDLHLLSSEMTNNSSGEQHLEEEAMRKREDKNQTIELIAKRREERFSLQTVLEDIEVELKELKRLHKGRVEGLKDLEVKINRLDVELETRLTHLREEYMLSYEAAKEAFPLSIDVEDARKKVKLIKLAIDELGTVNLGAIDEYERVSERYEFLLEQQNDLLAAKDTLFQVIDEMDVEMKRRFQETFEGIRFHFESVFQSLFGGGRADLKFTNPEDLLNTGIDIVAQPPGKKLQNLGLLSGGERALTAIALLFSILKVRPVPFCILDEVEAALDEANVHRYAKYLRNYSHETQFIVITHRKGTMEEADVLYGVTMQESGVSKMVSVRLEETKEMAMS
ncbi:chromosome segregation protein SMC [Cytobacillus kochii]|uniref:chromosome segregation protein SMC n=1 Tax=Cytobacillus kochii TaxID=859143 RepID=UPI00277E0E24|nr:chromosome segregation protein SMC [Cytobacillus kochii]MDQ0184857.1 chromosome segregation protein [Cytobacillus kochii]